MDMKKYPSLVKCLTTSAFALHISFVSEAAFAQAATPASVQLNLDMSRSVGGVNTLSREKYINVHAINSDLDWWGGNGQSLNQPNLIDDYLTDFVKGNDVYFGRDSGGIGYEVSITPQSATPGYADLAWMVNTPATPAGAKSPANNYKNYGYQTAAHKAIVESNEFEKRMNSWILTMIPEKFYPVGGKVTGAKCTTTGSWSFSTGDSATEPYGTATGKFAGKYLANYFIGGSITNPSTGHPRPTFVEGVNEPIYNLVDIAVPNTGSTFGDCAKKATYDDIFKYHTNVRAEINALNSGTKTVKFGGYTPAFPDLEEFEKYPADRTSGSTAVFAKWNARDALWMSNHAKNMDFLSLHIYDFDGIKFDGVTTRRINHKGNNIEAILDTYDSAQLFASGVLKPIVISEFGGRLHTAEGSAWTPQRDWSYIKAMNSLMIQFMQRPDRIAKAVPFVPLKAEWGRVSPTIPYQWRLFRQEKEDGVSTSSKWTYTELVKFYKQWNGVNGTRLDTYANDQDIQTDAYYDSANKTVWLILNNLEENGKTLNLATAGLNTGNAVSTVEVRHLYPNTTTGVPVLDVYSNATIPASIGIGAESTIIMKIVYNNTLSISNSNSETKYYATVNGITSALKAIAANTAMTFNINNVTTGANGEAVLRVSVGRPITASLQPIVTLNGTAVTVPTDYRGYDQNRNGSGRFRFFGTLEIPVARSLIQQNNTIVVTFPDAGGSVSAVALQNRITTRALSRP